MDEVLKVQGLGDKPANAASAPASAVLSQGATVAVDQSANHTEAEKDVNYREETYEPCESADKPVSDKAEETVSATESEGIGPGASAAGMTPERKERKKEERQRRSKGTGGLQLERTGMWTVRCIINGRRVSKSTGTKDRDEAERFLKKFLSPYVKDDAERTFENIKIAVASERQRVEMDEEKRPQMSLDEVWEEYERSPMRRDLAKTTLEGKKQVWRVFREWMHKIFPEVSELRHVQRHHCEAYLNELRNGHSSLTYNGRLCVLREMTRVLARKALVRENPWEGFQMRADDSHTRRELTVEELARLIDVAGREGFEWKVLFAIAMYTGLRLGDCCKLTWGEVDVVRSLIQKIPEKTKKYRKGKPVTIPIHATLADLLVLTPIEKRSGYVLPQIGQWASEGTPGMGKIHHRLGKIFHNAGIVTSVSVEGRKWKAPEAGFHSLRHTFVSMSANAGVPLHIVQSIVGHESTTMTRHYYHENIEALQRAVEAIPSISETGEVREGAVAQPDASRLYNKLPPPRPVPLIAGGEAIDVAPAAPEAPMVVSDDGVERANPNADAPLVGRSAAKNAARREEKFAAVRRASTDAAQMGGWGLKEERGSQLPTINRRQRQEWISKCVRKWCVRSKIAILEGTTMLLGNGGYRFLQQVWESGTQMMPDDAIDAMDVFLKANGGK